jgi:hypothetical protein
LTPPAFQFRPPSWARGELRQRIVEAGRLFDRAFRLFGRRRDGRPNPLDFMLASAGPGVSLQRRDFVNVSVFLTRVDEATATAASVAMALRYCEAAVTELVDEMINTLANRREDLENRADETERLFRESETRGGPRDTIWLLDHVTERVRFIEWLIPEIHNYVMVRCRALEQWIATVRRIEAPRSLDDQRRIYTAHAELLRQVPGLRGGSALASDALLAAVRISRHGIIVGEEHLGDGNQPGRPTHVRDLLIQNMDGIYRAGVRALCLELPGHHQVALDEFQRTGDEQRLLEALLTPQGLGFTSVPEQDARSLVRLAAAAQARGITLHAMDTRIGSAGLPYGGLFQPGSDPHWYRRFQASNPYMEGFIDRIAQTMPPEHRVLVLVGGAHTGLGGVGSHLPGFITIDAHSQHSWGVGQGRAMITPTFPQEYPPGSTALERITINEQILLNERQYPATILLRP